MFARTAPALFVLIWSSGFVVARWAVPHAAPELILFVRMALAALVMAAAALVAREAWPRGSRLAHHVAAGALLNGGCLCASWWAISRGMPAGIMALLGALQPLLVALAAFAFWGERLPPRGWAGLGIGLAGVVMVLAPLLGIGFATPIPFAVLAAAIVAILAMTSGTMIQSGALRQDGMIVSGALQQGGGALVALAAMVAQGDYRWDNSPMLWAGLAWSVLILSVAGLSLLVWMTRHHGATRMSLLLLLVPPVTAILTWLLFGERLTALQLAGFALTLAGVQLARGRPKAAIVEPV